MSEVKYLEKFTSRFSKAPAFTTADAKIFLGSLGAKKNYSYLLLSNLLKRGKLHRLKKGAYSFKDDPVLAGFAFPPSYHGLQDALSIKGLWEQETNTVIITPRKVRSGAREMLGGTVIVRRIGRKMFFGFESVKYSGTWISVSDVEKTLIDFAYFKQPLDAATIREIKKRVDKKQLEEYLKKCPKWVAKRVRKMLGK